ncbi:RNA polymerase I-associated factor PAF67 family protein [Theileria parva strain Muguga]|uniref:RNA polymerase I-associated factor PAF67 family protein n=1 Tax=Theileria parva strain Muguga TaxID=333668 RepID=UPI001C61943B|nr:RNA polymerase I-associated factor PAF67 family protein [Theileria parva strain Muguga]EAN32530.2 RNA polymerase I-associated factor PAF67 family protein [Theileria parva strain Muguga]
MDNNDSFRQTLATDGPQRTVTQLLPIEPEVVDFLVRLHDNLYRKNAEALKNLYEQELNVITDKYFKSSRWPSISDVAGFYSQSGRFHNLIMALYAEIYYRHAFYLGEASYEDRVDSWNKYVRLLTYFIEECNKPEGSEGLSGLTIPSSWVWDMLDEFVYQLQESCHWKIRFCSSTGSIGYDTTDTKSEIEQRIKETVGIWCVPVALELLHELANNPMFKSACQSSKDVHLDTTSLNYQLGYFASICLLRLHVLLGDYYTSLTMASNVDLSPRSLYWKIPACNVTLIYYLGFAFMMLRRYNDAIRILSQLLIFLTKQRSYLVSQSYQQSAMSKQTEKMYLIIILCHVTTRIKLDETVIQTIKEQYSNKFYQLQVDNEDSFRDVFHKACPKFIDPAGPSLKLTESPTVNEPLQRQVQIFLEEINKQRKVNEIYSYAKLYHNISLKKLGVLMNAGDDPEVLRSQILCAKHHVRQFVSNSFSLYHTNLLQTFGDRDDLYIDQNVLHIKSKKNQKIYAEYFLQQINKCKQTLNNLQSKRDDQQNKKEKVNVVSQ